MSNEFIVKFPPFDKGRIFFDSVAETGNIAAKNGNNVGATFDFVERIVRLVAFDNVASTLLLVWTGLYVLPVLWMTSCFHIMGRNQLDDVMFGRVRQVAAPFGGRAARLRLLLRRSLLSLIALLLFQEKLLP